MPKVYIRTYGCQMNERDSEQVARQLQDRGYEMTDRETEADVILLNTCSVRDQAEQKALGNMNRLRDLKKDRPGLVLGFMGCMAQSRGQALLDKLPDVDLVVGTQRLHRVAEQVEALRAGTNHAPRVADVGEEAGSERAIRDHLLTPRQPSAFISIMQGCNMHCSFCIVPATRGAERSRPIDEIVAEARALAGQGVREVTLLGQIVNFYGRHEFPVVRGRTPFVQLLEALQEVEGLARVRFTSPHPNGFREDLIGAMADLAKLCEHVHLPVQSGSDRMLRVMRRGYTADKYRRIVARLRERVPGLAITTDFIVGYPGETEAEFGETLALAREIQFDQAFIFRYSPRKDTPAAALEGQHSEGEKQRRNQELLAIIDDSVRRRLEARVGQEVEVLVEGPSPRNPSRLTGRTRNNQIVVFTGGEELRGRLLNVRIERSLGFSLLGVSEDDLS